MADENFITENDSKESVKKVKKPRKPMSDERKAQLREQLKKGRETALANRQKKAKLKKIEKEEKSKDEDKKIAEFYSKKAGIKNETNDNKLEELMTLLKSQQEEINNLKNSGNKFIKKEEEGVKINIEKKPKEELPKKVLRKTKEYDVVPKEKYDKEIEKEKGIIVLDENRRIVEIPKDDYNEFVKYKEYQVKLKKQNQNKKKLSNIKQAEYQMERLKDNVDNLTKTKSKPIPIPKKVEPPKPVKKTYFAIPDF